MKKKRPEQKEIIIGRLERRWRPRREKINGTMGEKIRRGLRTRIRGRRVLGVHKEHFNKWIS